ncbi:hypothetical protein NCC78_14750 [Micromonospora phytophila]|nr:hypothetical protein [Micromonospora phytophila]MCM0675939.1 hypothetical protein [Micromonospora phytophila]
MDSTSCRAHFRAVATRYDKRAYILGTGTVAAICSRFVLDAPDGTWR